MIENDADRNGSPKNNGRQFGDYGDYLRRAAHAQEQGESLQALFLDLLAFDAAKRDVRQGPIDLPVEHPAVEGLRQAWELSCKLGERSLAEYVFEKLQRYLTAEDIERYSGELQKLALHKLEEFGLTREDVEDVADMISEDCFGVKGLDLTLSKPSAETALAKTSVEDSTPTDEAQHATQKDEQEEHSDETLTYDELIGFDSAIAAMRQRGFGMKEDKGFEEFIEKLNARHGIEKLPSLETLLFRSPAREDADRLMLATAGEMGLPTLRMHMDQNAQGVPVLCVMASSDFKSKLNMNFNSIEGSALLMLEDIDLWGLPMSEGFFEDLDGISVAQLSRGARKAIMLIRSAVDNPDVTVFASASSDSYIDDFMFGMLNPIESIDVAQPDSAERGALWRDIVAHHSSLSKLDLEALVRYSDHMSRYDICMAAREAIEEAYTLSVKTREYVAVTKDNIFDKIAAYQPLDSKEYHEIEDAIVADFRDNLDDFEGRFKGKA